MIRTIITLLAHDLAVAFKNKTVYLIVFIPIFVFATLTLVETSGTDASGVKIALVHSEPYPPVVLKSITRSTGEFSVRWASDEEEATRMLKQREVDGVLMHDIGDKARLQLSVIQQASIQTLAIMQHLSALQAASEGNGPGWIASVRSLQTGSVKRQTLPIWILTMLLIVSFIVLPAQVAEEKEKQLLLGWMQTPVRESEWLIAKLAYGLVLILISVAALQSMGGESCFTHAAGYLAMLCAGGFCFGALGTCLGLLCRSQASARTLGVLCYLPLLLPAALSDMSPRLRALAPLVPSYQFYEPVRAMLLEGSGLACFTHAWINLLAIGMLACLVSHRLIRKRWLM